MKNKLELKRYIFVSVLLVILLACIFFVINSYQVRVYRTNYNNKISEILFLISRDYPEIEKSDIVKLLNSADMEKASFLEEYGIDVDNESIVFINDVKQREFMVFNCLFIIFSFLILFSVFLIYLFKKDKKIREITKLIEEINKKNYSLEIDSVTEDELSILKSELYKTTIFLKEQAENSINDKISLKNSLEDISHQLKTPLTSIMISLDNLIDVEDMDESTRVKFLNKIKREISNINFFVVSLLNLTKLDTNNLKFINDYCLLSDLINESIENVSVLSDLKGIDIEVSSSKEISVYCDAKWQIEAITNVLKNAVEHSKDGSKIRVILDENKVFVRVVINNDGVIEKEDLPNIFKRFYKGMNAKEDSVGIGLALAKTIIEKNNGRIQVESNENIGTTFTIKYFKS